MTQSRVDSERIDYHGLQLFVGIDVGKKSWQVTIRTRTNEVRSFSASPKTDALVSLLRREYYGAEFLAGYEAGYSGFWLQRQLTAHGIACVVLNPADIASTDKDRRRKSDSIDARRIAAELANDVRPLRTVYVPSVAHEEARALVRARNQAVNSCVRAKMRTLSLLDQMGIEPRAGKRVTFRGESMSWLRTLTLQTAAGTEALQLHIDDVEQSQRRVQDIVRRMLALGQQEPWRRTVEVLTSIKGVGPMSAVIWAVEIGPWDRCPSADHLVSYVGLVPESRQSSTMDITLGITPRAASYLRPLLLQNTHSAARHDAELRAIHQTLMARGKKSQEAKIYVAKRLLLRMRAVALRGTPYVQHTPRVKKLVLVKPKTVRPSL